MELSEGYIKTEVGVIPKDWNLKTLEELTVDKGLVRGPFGGALKKEYFVSSGYKVYEQRNAIYASTDIGNYYVTEDKFRELKRFELRPSDFIVSCSGTIGKIFQVPFDAPRGIINQALLKITLSDLIDHDYFLHYFKSSSFQSSIIEGTQGGAMKNLVGMGEFKNTPLPLPPTKAEQSAIATTLSDVDALMTQLEKIITKKRQIKQGAMQTLLNPFDEDGKLKPGWKEKLLGEAATLKARIGWQGLTTAEYLITGDYFLITGTEFNKGFIDWESCHYVELERYRQDRNIQVKPNDVLVTKDGTIGKVAFIRDVPKPATLNSGVFVIRPINDSFDPEFFYYILMSDVFTQFLIQLSAGSTISHLYQKDFVHFKFFLPKDINDQKTIANIFSDMDAEILALESKLAKARDLKNGMMQTLLTGQIRLVKPKKE